MSFDRHGAITLWDVIRPNSAGLCLPLWNLPLTLLIAVSLAADKCAEVPWRENTFEMWMLAGRNDGKDLLGGGVV